MSKSQLKHQLSQAFTSLEKADVATAAEGFQSVLRTEPQNLEALTGMAQLYINTEQFERAIALLQQICQLRGKLADLLALAACFNGVSHADDARKVLEFAVAKFPDSAQAHYHLALHCIGTGQNDQAIAILEPLRGCDEPLLAGYAYLDLTRISDKVRIAQTIDSIKTMLTASGNRHHTLAMVLNYALGLSCDRLGKLEMASQYLQQANRLQLAQCDFNVVQMSSFFDRLIQCYQPDNDLSCSGADHAITPVFIVGMPRTGSTLLEQMLCTHPQIQSVGEANYLASAAVKFLEYATQKPFPECATEASSTMLEHAAKQYMQRLQQHRFTGSLVINKLPANFQNVGVIMQLFANAKVIDIRRNPAEVAFSVYKHYFAQNEPYFCDIEQFHCYYQSYCNLMPLWQQRYSDKMLTVNYEDLIRDPQRQSTRLSQFLGCQLDERFLSPHDGNSYVSTLSATQVKQPIYSEITAQSPAYRTYLPKLRLFDEHSD